MILNPGALLDLTSGTGWRLSLLGVFWWLVRWLRCTTCTAAVIVPPS
ncbi:hypothetical protein [Mycobacteroides chelonae]|nr:hypothetical protein [Mycobacteroides chelonae]